jgi:prepilin-type N-terminal cleavage/methylation domain-containing protein
MKGFTLIETIIYLALLSILVTGIFGAILSEINRQKEPNFSQEDYEMLIKNYHEE